MIWPLHRDLQGSIVLYTKYFDSCKISRDENEVYLLDRKFEIEFYKNFEMCGLFFYMYFV
jgi:hypothetical protein